MGEQEILTKEEAGAMRSVLARTSCQRQATNNFEPAACRYPIEGLPRSEWCDTCIAKDALEPTPSGARKRS